MLSIIWHAQCSKNHYDTEQSWNHQLEIRCKWVKSTTEAFMMRFHVREVDLENIPVFHLCISPPRLFVFLGPILLSELFTVRTLEYSKQAYPV